MSENDQSGLLDPSGISRRKAVQVLGGTTAGAALVPGLAHAAGGSRSGPGQSLRAVAARARAVAVTPTATFQNVDWVNVMNYGAKCDGVTNDSAAVAAMLKAVGTSPAVFYFPGPTISGKVTLHSGQWIAGDSYEKSKLIAAPGLNDNLVESFDFASFTGKNSSNTPYNLGIFNITLDGNKFKQTGSSGGPSGMANVVSLYAYGYALMNVRIRNGHQVGLWTEWGTATAGVGNDSMESFVSNFKIHNCDGVHNKTVGGGEGTTSGSGMVFMGPHDTQIWGGILSKNGTGSGSIAIDLPIDGRANGGVIEDVHVWGGTYDTGIRIMSSGITLGDTVQVEGGLNQQIIVGASLNRIAGKFFSGNIRSSTVKGIVIGTSAKTADNVNIRAKVENCGGAVLDLTHSAGDHDIDIHATYYNGIAAPSPAVIGTLDNHSTMSLLVIDKSGAATADTELVVPGKVGGIYLVPRGLTGATEGSRFVGAIGSGAPSTGTYSTGDVIISRAGAIFVCTSGGSPGTFAKLGSIATTAADIQPHGTQSPGSNGIVSDSGHVHPASDWTLADNGFLAVSYDPNAAAAATGNITAGTVHLVKIPVRADITAAHVTWFVNTAGSGTSTGSYTGLYSSSGTLLSGSADIAPYLTSTGPHKIPLTTAQSLTAGTFVWAVLLSNLSSTQPMMCSGLPFASLGNANLTPSTYRFTTNGTGQTSLPSSIRPSSNTGTGITAWAGLS